MSDNDCYGAALVLHQRGYSVVPFHLSIMRDDGTYLCTCRTRVNCKGKHPALPTWLKYQTQLSTETEIHQWFTGEYSWCNLGFFHGSSNTIAIDFDGDIGQDTKHVLEKELGPLPETVTMFTGGGGEQLIYRQPPNVYIPTIKNLKPCLDVRGEKGVSMCPPSIHPFQSYYHWDVDHHPEDWTPQPLPDAWVKFLEETPPEPPPVTYAPNTTPPAPNTPTNTQGLITDGREEVMRKTVFKTYHDLIRQHGSIPDEQTLTSEAWNRYSALVDLSRPGRGYSELQTKVRAILRNRHMPQPLTKPPRFGKST